MDLKIKEDQKRRINEDVLRLGRRLHRAMKGESPGLFQSSYWQNKLIHWTMQDPEFRIDMFRFLDVLPSLARTDQISSHLREYLLKPGRELPTVMKIALMAASGGLASGVAAKALKKNVSDMASRFIAGKDPVSAIQPCQNLLHEGFAITADLLGEVTLSEKEADNYKDRYLSLIETLAQNIHLTEPNPILEKSHLGSLPLHSVSIKISSMAPYLNSANPEEGVERLLPRIEPLLLKAQALNVAVCFDMEHYELHEITFKLFEHFALDQRFKDWPHLGIVIQAYLKNAEQDLEHLLSLAQQRKCPLSLRLVKGAYWDTETVLSSLTGKPCPVFEDKALTDLNYEKLTWIIFNHIQSLHPAFGSHNLRSLTVALIMAETLNIPDHAYEIQMLYGMAEPERKVFQEQSKRIRIYTPIGDMLPGMSYLVRRLLENTSNQGFLRLNHHEHQNIDKLLIEPRPKTTLQDDDDSEKAKPFINCALTDFTEPSQRVLFKKALDKTYQLFPKKVPSVISGQDYFSDKPLEHPCPFQPNLIISQFSDTPIESIHKAISIANISYESWNETPLQQRSQILLQLADRLEQDRFRLAALMVYECAKPWKEADADVAEAVDFCRYYANRSLIELKSQAQGQHLGETNILGYEGRGTCAVIAPWNFPFAILCGMSCASLVAGNSTLIKPAEQSTLIGYAFYQHLIAAGIPKDVVHFLPGTGELVGRTLVEHPEVHTIAFTGSLETGQEILQQASILKGSQTQLKRVIAELGGKNAIIIDEDADLDEAISGVIESAFGYSGQKCSACSRLILLEQIAEETISRLIESVKNFPIGPADQAHVLMSSVIDLSSAEKLKSIIQNPGENIETLFHGEFHQESNTIPPFIFKTSDPQHNLMQQELFGPVLGILIAKNFDHAIELANQSSFALTGAVYSRSPSRLALARKLFKVGNLYLNRGSTGAVVGRQPFGGFMRSGYGLKAGGPNYLLQFAQPQCITENTMRRGFTPESQ